MDIIDTATGKGMIVNIPAFILSANQLAAVIINSSSIPVGLESAEDKKTVLIEHLLTYSAPNTEFAQLCILTTIRDFGFIEADVNVAVRKMNRLGMKELQARHVLESITEHMYRLWPALKDVSHD